MGRTIAEALREEGEQKGLQKGELRTKRKWLVELLRIRFGKVPAATVKRIKATKRLDLLDAWFKQASVAKTLAEVSFSTD